MPPRKRNVPGPDGNPAVATVMPFQAGGEHWNEYMVDDGTVIRIKLVVTDVLRLDDVYDANGDPLYLVQSTNVTNVSAPEDLRKDGNQ